MVFYRKERNEVAGVTCKVQVKNIVYGVDVELH